MTTAETAIKPSMILAASQSIDTSHILMGGSVWFHQSKSTVVVMDQPIRK